MHQATERHYRCVLLVLTLYSPKLHRLDRLRSQAESLNARSTAAWPRDTKFARRCFARLNRTYVEARYAPHYEITSEELAWLTDRVDSLSCVIESICPTNFSASPK
ncbi:HEPN domain-containing protein [Methylobacterium mesophilicum SR1.6/6]|uniref:HEPN domain-containing protein n=1 Tax=Methylobacterium mesophilicum SR1.6/6 TaxID=908290 RepID=A0A6B9FH96_9HYPH|nr:HEPN domain-containing protein [Methylobacterium mesophilicum SR1.6/6]